MPQLRETSAEKVPFSDRISTSEKASYISRSVNILCFLLDQLRRSHKPARKLPVLVNSDDFSEAVFQSDFLAFSDDFRSIPAGKHRKLIGIHRKKSGQFSGRNTAPMLQRFPMVSCRIRWLSRIFSAGSCGIRWPESSTWVSSHWICNGEKADFFGF